MMKKFGLICLMILGCVMAGCDTNVIKNPPLAITFRPGILSSSVMQVNNLSTDEGIEVYVYVASAENSVRSGNVVIPANEKKEFGALELGKWDFKPGDQGFVCPMKYARKLFFRILQDGSFQRWFGYNDIPEVNVAAQVFAKKMTDMKADGMRLYVAITNANAAYAASGRGTLWPKPQGTFKERAKEKFNDLKAKVASKLGKGDGDVTAHEKKFKTAGEYWEYIFDVDKMGTDKYSPVLGDLPLSVVFDATDKKKGGIPAEAVRWSILANYSDDLADRIPVLISANFPCEKLRSFRDGQEGASEKIALDSSGVTKGYAFIVVYKNGEAEIFSALEATLADIYSAAFNTCTNGYNRPIQYLTLAGVVDAVGAIK
jgi:hypothetical protein